MCTATCEKMDYYMSESYIDITTTDVDTDVTALYMPGMSYTSVEASNPNPEFTMTLTTSETPTVTSLSIEVSGEELFEVTVTFGDGPSAVKRVS
jgi:hypothetical protein